MSLFVDPLLWLIELIAVFIALSIYGAMWKGAQDQAQKGWFIALIWAVALVAALNGLRAGYILLS
ncbi:hypothetical protein [Synechococcus sp. W4D4]|uniref:hypothetical protein n=1 Tax=Synechococcus sp. W4D4 TaxID=3392294 RepID=UPI0039EC37D8